MEAGYGAIAIQIIGFGLAGCALHHIIALFRHPERLDEIYHPRRKHPFDYKPKLTIGPKMYLVCVFLGLLALTTTFVSVLLDWDHITVSRVDALNPLGLLAGFLGASGMMSAIASQVKKTVSLEVDCDRLRDENEKRTSTNNLNEAEKTELDRLRRTTADDRQTIIQLENTVAALQKQIPVTIRFEG